MAHNPLLDKLRIPGETFRLPSQGIFYKNGELDATVVNGEVEVNPMTTRDEIVLSTPDKLLSGKAIEEIFGRCIPQILKPSELLARDVDFLMVCLRMVTFGPQLEIIAKHSCEDAHEHRYNVDLGAMIRATRAIDPTTISNYSVNLATGQKVMLKPLTYASTIHLYQATALGKTNEIAMSEQEAQVLIVDTLASVIESVDGITDYTQIREWLLALPRKYKQQLQTAAQTTSSWGVDFSIQEICKDCSEPMEIFVTPDPVSFFF